MSDKSKVYKVLCYFQYSNADNLHVYQERLFQEHRKYWDARLNHKWNILIRINKNFYPDNYIYCAIANI